MRKKIIALFLLYALQFLATACSSKGECGDHAYEGPSAFEITYTDVLVTSFDTSGFQNIPSEENIPKNAFGLVINFDLNENPIAKQEYHFNLAGFGFSSALACSPVQVAFIYLDPVRTIEILVTDVNTNTVLEVTERFTITNFQEEDVPFSTFLQDIEVEQRSFQLDLAVFDTIPDTAIFTVNVTLESGTILTKSTNNITFI